MSGIPGAAGGAAGAEPAGAEPGALGRDPAGDDFRSAGFQSAGFPSAGFQSDVQPPPRPRPSVAQLLGRIAFGLLLAVLLVGSVVVGRPALEISGTAGPGGGAAARPAAGTGR
jgi:hypothetical protein